MTDGCFERIEKFDSEGWEYSRFLRWLEARLESGAVEELSHQSNFGHAFPYERYFREMGSDQVWSLTGPDGPLTGQFVPVETVSASRAQPSALRFTRWKLGCVGLLLLVFVGLGVGGAWEFGYLPVQPFSSAKWKERASEGVRLSMVDALIRKHRLEGMHRNEIVDLLGPPPDTAYFREWDAVYWLGPERGWIRIDSEWLVLKFGQDDRVTEWAIVRD